MAFAASLGVFAFGLWLAWEPLGLVAVGGAGLLVAGAALGAR